MTGQALHHVVLRAAGAPGQFAALSDGELLGRYVAGPDSAAFAELVRRHGAMVLGVARRELGNTPDAEDACQATFLVLTRKASAVRRAEAVGAWLYGVARRVSRKQAETRARRRERESPLADVSGPDTTAAVSLRDGLRVLDSELARLPEAWRAPLVLCYLEGRTQDEAAKQLGWSLGTFRGRLERGRARLRDRLTRRGVGLAILAAAIVTPPTPVSAAIQASILNTAAGAAAGEALAVPAAVAALAEGAIRTMAMTKLQWAAGVAAVCGVLTFGGVWATGQGPGDDGPATPPAAGRQGVDTTGETGRPAIRGEQRATSAQRRRSVDNLKHILLAVHNFHDANGYLPSDIRDKNGKAVLSWRVAILPYLMRDALYQKFRLEEPWDSEHNLKLLSAMPAEYRIGIEPKDSTHTYYQVFASPGRKVPLHNSSGAMLRGFGSPAGGGPVIRGEGAIRISDITDGTSNTIGVVEAAPPVPWTKPVDLQFDPKKPKVVSPFGNEWHVAMMDGSVMTLKPNIDPDVLRRLIIMNDGEIVPPMNALLAPRLAETPREKAALRENVQANQALADQVHELMRQLIDELGGKDGRPGDAQAEEEIATELKQMADRLREQIGKARREETARPGPAK